MKSASTAQLEDIQVTLARRRESIRGTLKLFRVLLGSARKHDQLAAQHCGLSASQLWALWEIGRSPGSRALDVAKVMAIHLPAAQDILEVLRARGLARITGPADNPGTVRMALTGEGQALLDQAAVPPQGLLYAALEQLDEPALNRLANALRPLVEGLTLSDSAAALVPLSDMARHDPRDPHP